MIEIKNLAKKFAVENPKKLSENEKKDPRLVGRFFHSVKDVSFFCGQGEVLALLGPNGAGKTTTLRMLSTALEPDNGEILINQVNLVKRPLEVRKTIGFLSGTTGLYRRLTGRENIAYFGKLHGMKDKDIAQRTAMLSEMLDMDGFLDRQSDNYSSGMKQKTAIARAVIHSPKVVILDEPTTGLDIMATQVVLNFVKHLKSENVPVIFSTHHLDEVEEVSDRVAVIDKGVSSFLGTFEEFKALSDKGLHQSFMSALSHDSAQQSVQGTFA